MKKTPTPLDPLTMKKLECFLAKQEKVKDKAEKRAKKEDDWEASTEFHYEDGFTDGVRYVLFFLKGVTKEL